MRVHAISDVHVDYDLNARWISALSRQDYTDDVLILAGDVSDDLSRLRWCLTDLSRRFRKVVFVPGNHDLWVMRDDRRITSFEKLDLVRKVASDCGVSTAPHEEVGLSVLPILSWYDFSFGQPSADLRRVWADFTACRWPSGIDEEAITTRFLAETCDGAQGSIGRDVITFSHFVPRRDLLPWFPGRESLNLLPVLGTGRIDTKLRSLGAVVHVYGHSHVNRRAVIDGVTYVNSALGYPQETAISERRLRCVYER